MWNLSFKKHPVFQFIFLHPDSLGLSSDQQQRMYPGVLIQVGDYRISPGRLLDVIRINRRQGYDGEVLFFYEGLRAEDGRLADTLTSTVYREKAALPFDRAKKW